MAIPHAKPGEIVDVRPLGPALASAQTKTLVRTDQVEVIRLVVPAGKEIEEHKAKGEIENKTVGENQAVKRALTGPASSRPLVCAPGTMTHPF